MPWQELFECDRPPCSSRSFVQISRSPFACCSKHNAHPGVSGHHAHSGISGAIFGNTFGEARFAGVSVQAPKDSQTVKQPPTKHRTGLYPVKELSRSLINPQDQNIKNLIHLLKYVNQTRDFVFVMEPQLPVRNQEGKFPVQNLQIVSCSDSDWASCQKSRKSTSGSLVSVFNVNLQSTSRTHASIAHSAAESELYAMTQATVESLAIKNFIQGFSLAILSSSVSIVIQTDSSARKSMASRLGISRHSKHIELKYLWVQDEVKRGKLELKKVGTHFNPSDVLTKYVPASVLGQHLPRLNIFKVNSQRSTKSVPSSVKQVQYLSRPQPPSTSPITPTTLSIFMFSFTNYDHQEALRLRFRQASRSIKCLLTPPRRGSGDQGDSSVHRHQHVIHHDSEAHENQ